MDRVTPRNDADTIGTVVDDIDVSPDRARPGQKVFIVLAGPGFEPYVDEDPGPPRRPPSGGGQFTLTRRNPAGNFGLWFVLTPVSGSSR
jgi:hypothetical protein